MTYQVKLIEEGSPCTSQNLSSVSTFISRSNDRLRTRILIMREMGEIPQGTLISL